MSTSVISDSVVISPGPDNGSGPTAVIHGPTEVDFVKCECCGLSEECTLSYIETIRERYGGKWICGLCGEAVKDEILRCNQKLISTDEALARHLSFCSKFRVSGPPEDPTVRLIRAMSQVLRKSLESPKLIRSMPSSPINKRGNHNNNDLDLEGNNVLARSESCMPSLTTMVESVVYCSDDDDCEL